MKARHLAAIAAAAVASAGPALAQDKQDIAWGGSNPGGVMYYMVGVAGTEISNEFPDINVTQVTTGGSTENAKRLIKGELDMGIVYGSHVYMGQRQEGPFEDDPKADMFRGVAKAYEGPTYFVTARRFRHQGPGGSRGQDRGARAARLGHGVQLHQHPDCARHFGVRSSRR